MKLELQSFVLGVGATALVLLSIAFAQERLRVEANQQFEPVQFLSDKNTFSGPSLSVAPIRMSDGTTCYVLTNAKNAIDLDSMSELVGLGCVRE